MVRKNNNKKKLVLEIPSTKKRRDEGTKNGRNIYEKTHYGFDDYIKYAYPICSKY